MQIRHSRLSQPYESLLPLVTAEAEILAASEPLLSSPYAGASVEVVERLEQAVSQQADSILELSHQIFDNPELSFEEYASAESVAGLLESAGLEVERGAFGLPTAFRASIGNDRPAVAILAEYDALPEIGHGCGHNIICASAVGAFLALSTIADSLPGAVWLIGTPAEERGAAKERIVRAGAFDAIDAAIMAHPGTQDVGTFPRQGMRYVDVTYHGIEAHASGTPFLGRNALDAVVAAYNGIAMLRQHMLPSDRVHGVITDGGQRPNIVPGRAQATFYVRSARSRTMRELNERVDQIFRAAAEMTGTSVDIAWDPFPEELPVRTNQPLLERFAVHMRHRGRRVLRRNAMEFSLEGSTDLGNVSVKVPGIHPLVAVAPAGVAAHTREFGTYARGESGDAACLDSAFALASCAADLLWDSELRAAVADDFATAEKLDGEGVR